MRPAGVHPDEHPAPDEPALEPPGPAGAETAVEPTDAELARAWQSGGSTAFDAVYRRFAPALFGTALALVDDRSSAGDVVHETFVRAATRIGTLREPSRLRAWLFAILRNEVASWRRAGARVTISLDQGAAPVSEWLEDDAPAADVEASRRELRELVWTAADGLQPRDREVLELHLRGGLEAGDLAVVMGVTPGHAAVMLTRMRDRLERCLGAVMIARSGRPDCPGLDRLLDGWDGRFSLAVRGRVVRHIESCPVCVRRREGLVSLDRLAPALLPPAVLLPEQLHVRLVSALTQLSAQPAAAAVGAPSDAVRQVPDQRRDEAWRDDGFPRSPADPGAGLPWDLAPHPAASLEIDLEFDPDADVALGEDRESADRRRRRRMGLLGIGSITALAMGGWWTVDASVSGRRSVVMRPTTPPLAFPGELPAPAPSLAAGAGSAAASGRSPALVPSPRPSPTPGTSPVPMAVPAAPDGPDEPGGAVPGVSPTSTPGPTAEPPSPTATATSSSAGSSSGEPSSEPPTPAPSPPAPRPGPTSPAPTSTPVTSPQILAVGASPVLVMTLGCTPETAAVTVSVASSLPVSGTVSWTPGVAGAVTSPLVAAGAGVLSGQVGPFTAIGQRTLTVTVTDTAGNSTVGTTTLTVQNCLVIS
ncbi:MAG: sigma-70 family RNA polymerase sigma factor [Kineosporiaceae bacterium]